MIRKFWIGSLVVLFLVLAACAKAPESDESLTGKESVEGGINAPQESPLPAPTQEELVESDSTTEPTCVPDEPKPTPPPEILEVFSPDPEIDWIKGPEDAAVTIVEYGDFQ